MTLYLDSSALAKRYVAESGSQDAEALLLSDLEWITANHTYTEIALTLRRRLEDADARLALDAFERDWRRTLVVVLDEVVCRSAAAIGVVTALRTLDALHLAAAERAGGRSIPIVTYDLRLAQAARAIGFPVLGR